MLDAEDLLASSLVRNVLSPEEIQRAEEDEDWLNYRIEEEGEKVFTLSWESSMPGTCGASWIIRWRGLYFFRSSDLDPDGPFPTLDAALSIEYLSQFASFHQIDSGAIPRNETKLAKSKQNTPFRLILMFFKTRYIHNHTKKREDCFRLYLFMISESQ